MRKQHHHVLKTHPQWFNRWIRRNKSFEIRKDDRIPRYEAGDTVEQRELNPVTMKFTGRIGTGTIVYVLRGFEGIAPGYCAIECPFEKMKVVHGKTDEQIANDLNRL